MRKRCDGRSAWHHAPSVNASVGASDAQRHAVRTTAYARRHSRTVARPSLSPLAVMLPTKRRIYCVLRSPHVNSNSREHFEIRSHHRLVDLKNLSAETVSMMMQWVPPSGVEVECSIA